MVATSTPETERDLYETKTSPSGTIHRPSDGGSCLLLSDITAPRGEAPRRSADLFADKSQVVSPVLQLVLRAVQDCGKILMGQSALCLVLKHHPDIVRDVCFKLPGSCIREIMHFPGRLADPLCCLRPDVSISVQRLAHRRGRNPALPGNILDCHHNAVTCRFVFLNRFRTLILNRFR